MDKHRRLSQSKPSPRRAGSCDSPQIFVSYARGEGEPFVRRLLADLRKRQFRIWWDREAMQSRGRTFHQEIHDAIASAERVLLVLDPRAAGSEYVQAEWGFALDNCVAVTPILRGGSYDLLPVPLSELHCVDFRGIRPYDDAITELAGILSEPVSKLARLHGVDPLPPHYLTRLEESDRLRRMVLAGILTKEVLPPARRTIALSGMGGAGKSVLAASFARSCEARRAFPDGVIWLKCGTALGSLSAARLVGRAFKDPAISNVPDRPTAALHLHSLLERKACLVVLDDLWDQDVAELFLGALGPHGRMIVTSRDRRLVASLEGVEHEVGMLSDDEAMQLLSEWSGQAADTLPAVAGSIARECGNLPLALGMVGAMVRGYRRNWDLALRRLQQSDLEKITRQFPGYPHPDLLRAIAVSVDALGPKFRKRYLDLAVFPKGTGIPESAVAGLWASADFDADRSLEFLNLIVDRSLARRDEQGRLSLHDLQVDFVRRKVKKLRSAHRRLIKSYRKLCEDGWESGPRDGYFLDHLAYHLVEAGRAGELRELLLRVPWLRARLDAGHPSDLIADYELIDGDRSLRLVEDALRLSAHVLTADRRQLATQLTARLLGTRDPDVRLLLRRIRRSAEDRWLRPLLPSLNPPGGLLERTLQGIPDWWVGAVALSADGRLAASADSGNRVNVWDVTTGKRLRILEGHQESVQALAVSHDGKVAATGSKDLTCRIWNMESGELLHTLRGHSEAVRAVVLTPDGTGVVSASEDGSVRVWCRKTGAALKVIRAHREGVMGLACLGGGRHVISASRDALLKVWDIDSGRCLQTLRGHTHFVYSVSAFDQGRRAISASADKTLKIWDLEEGRELATLEGHAQKVYSVAATQDGRLAVSGSRDRTLRIWNLEKGELAHTLSDHNGRVWSVAISLDGHRAASAAGDGTVKIWDPRVSPIERFPGHAMHVKGVHLSRDSRRALTVSNDSVKLWDVRRGNLLGSRTVGSWISEAHMTPDGRRAVYVSGKGSIRTWDLERNSDLHRLRARAGSVSKALLSERGHYLIVLSAGSTVLEVWRLRNKRSMRVLKKESKVEWQVTPVPYQDLMMVGTGRGPVRLLDPSTGEFRAKSIRERRTSKSIPASGGTRTVLRRGDRRIEVCDWARGVVLASMKFDWENFFLLALAPDGMLAAGSARLVGDNAIRVWDIGNGSLMCKLEGHESDVDTLAITADGRTLVSGSGDQTLRVWDLERGTQEAVFHAESGIEVCAVSADGRTIAAGEDSGRVLFFRLER